MPYTDQQITAARTFYKNFLDSNSLSLGEHSSVLALAAYSETFTAPISEKVEVESTEEYITLKESLDAKTAENIESIKQRNHNWNELQKSLTKIKDLESQLKAVNKAEEDLETK